MEGISVSLFVWKLWETHKQPEFYRLRPCHSPVSQSEPEFATVKHESATCTSETQRQIRNHVSQVKSMPPLYSLEKTTHQPPNDMRKSDVGIFTEAVLELYHLGDRCDMTCLAHDMTRFSVVRFVDSYAGEPLFGKNVENLEQHYFCISKFGYSSDAKSPQRGNQMQQDVPIS